MRTLLRCLGELRDLWQVWLPLLLLAVAMPPVILAMPLVEKELIDGVILGNRPDLLPRTIALYGGLWLLTAAGGVLSATLRTYLGERLALRLRRRLFAQCGALSLAFAHRDHGARAMALFADDVPALAGLFTYTVTSLMGTAVGLVLGIALMFSLSWQLALVAALAPPVVAGLAAVVTRPLRPAVRRVQEKAAEVTERLHEHVSGIREVTAFGQERAQGVHFAGTLGDLLRLRMRLSTMDAVIQSGQSAFWIAVSLVILGFGGYLVLEGQTTLGAVVAMRSLFGQVFQPAGQIAGLFSSGQRAIASAERVYAFLDETPRVTERPGARAPSTVAGAVTFDRVSFAYQPDRPVLHEVSFDARPGELVALVGPSGAGKSTVAGLIARFYDPTAGRVLLDGLDLRDLTLEGLRAQVGMVFQDTFLFATTIRDNIAFGRPGADDAEIEAAARAAHAWEFVERLPLGLDTPVGQRGVRLSEGQRQRLAIARALLRDPRILILDEPTSALDARSEHLLQSGLENLIRGRTTFVVAHRLSTVRRADRILVVDGGRVVQQGTHAELLERGGLYRELFELQFGRSVAVQQGTPALGEAVGAGA